MIVHDAWHNVLDHAVDSVTLGGVSHVFTTARQAGSFGLGTQEAVAAVTARWTTLADGLEVRGVHRLATAYQVHGATIATHGAGWNGVLRMRGVDGHVTNVPGTALAVTVADCTPVFIAHPAGAIAALHAGWRGTASRILDAGLDALAGLGYAPEECSVHFGPAICGKCYEVGPEVLTAVHSRPVARHGLLDVRAVLATQAYARGVTSLSSTALCTRCDNGKLFSHRAGDDGRQLGVIVLERRSA